MNASSSRYAANDFLIEVYRVHWEWRDRGCAKRKVALLNRQIGLARKSRQQPFKTLIVAAKCSPEAKVRSRCVRALGYALFEEIEPDELGHLFRANGGIAGCARLAAKRDPKRGPPRDDWADETRAARTHNGKFPSRQLPLGARENVS
jgi:hypothetical protein